MRSYSDCRVSRQIICLLSKKRLTSVCIVVYNVCISERGVIMRVNMTLNDELLKRLDTYAKANYMNRSSLVSFACNQFLMANELQSLMVDMKRAMQKIADCGTISDEQIKELEKFQMLCDMVTKQGETD